MARSPAPADSVRQALHFTPAATVHLDDVAGRAGTSFVGALNAELDFLRTWGLTPSRLRRLLAAATARKQSPRDYVKALLREAALKLPPATASARVSRLPKLGRRTSLFLTAPNHAVILEDCPAPRAFNSVLMAALAFAEHYELHPDLLVALDAEATRAGDLRRDVVLNILRNAAEALPPIAAPAAKRA